MVHPTEVGSELTPGQRVSAAELRVRTAREELRIHSERLALSVIEDKMRSLVAVHDARRVEYAIRMLDEAEEELHTAREEYHTWFNRLKEARDAKRNKGS